MLDSLHWLAVEVVEEDDNGRYGSDYGGAGIEESKYAHIAMFQPGRARQVSSTAQQPHKPPQTAPCHSGSAGED